MYEGMDEDRKVRRKTKNRDNQLVRVAANYAAQISHASRALDAHGGPKVLVRYEDLRAQPLQTMRVLCSELGLDVEEEVLWRTVVRHAWENVPYSRKGSGKFHRKARPGGWREDLTPDQATRVEGLTRPILDRFYPRVPGHEPRGLEAPRS